MSSVLLLSISSKLSLGNLTLRSSTNTIGIRMFSSTTTTNPYLVYHVACCEGEKAGAMTDLHIYDPAKEEKFVVGNKPLPKEMVDSRLVGSSHGWGVFFNTCPNNSILISDFCNPKSSKSNPKIISLHPRTRMKGVQSQIELVSGVAMSSSSPESQDFIMGLKYTGRLLNVFTHGQGRDEKLNLVYMYPQFFDCFEHAKLLYSKRDDSFYMPSAGGHHLLSWDGTELQDHELRFHGVPRFPLSELQLLDSCYRTHHIVESPSGGQRYLVIWYAHILGYKNVKFECAGTKRFMVFKEDVEEEEETNFNYTYTEDIGDLCIFLGKNNEPFCVQASSFPGLKPNSIYFHGQGTGVYDIATRTPRSFNTKSASAFSHVPRGQLHDWVPHWLPPFPL